MKQNNRFSNGKYPSTALKSSIIFSILLLLTSCSAHQGIAPKPLTTFSEKVTALVTTSVRSHIGGDRQKQDLLRRELPSLTKKTAMDPLIDHLKGIEPLKQLAQTIEGDVMFELRKPENQETKNNFNSPETQREVVSAILLGMTRALDQL